MWIKVLAIVGAFFALIGGVLMAVNQSTDLAEWGVAHLYDEKAESGPDWLMRIGAYCVFVTNEDEAIKVFQVMLTKHSTHPRAGEAQYMVGVCYRTKNESKVARAEFQKVIDQYPESPFVEKARERIKKIDITL